MIDKIVIEDNDFSDNTELLALKINEIIDHLSQEKESLCVGCSRTCKGIGIVTICAIREPTKESQEKEMCPATLDRTKCPMYKPTKEVPDIRPILEKVFQRGYHHGLGQGRTNDGETYAVDDAEKEISALYRKELLK